MKTDLWALPVRKKTSLLRTGEMWSMDPTNRKSDEWTVSIMRSNYLGTQSDKNLSKDAIIG